MPKPIYILIRHAEKTKSRVHLSADGRLRADSLYSYFTKAFPHLIDKIDAIYAEKQHHSYTSNRSVETVRPISKALNIPITNTFERHEIGSIIDDSQYHRHTVVLVCWEHKMLCKLSHQLEMPKSFKWSLNPYTAKVPCYDATWVMDVINDQPRLRVYKQFIIRNNQIVYDFPSCTEVFTLVNKVD